MDPADYVLRGFSSTDRAEQPFTLDTAGDAVETLVEVLLLNSEQRFHTPREVSACHDQRRSDARSLAEMMPKSHISE